MADAASSALDALTAVANLVKEIYEAIGKRWIARAEIVRCLRRWETLLRHDGPVIDEARKYKGTNYNALVMLEMHASTADWLAAKHIRLLNAKAYLYRPKHWRRHQQFPRLFLSGIEIKLNARIDELEKGMMELNATLYSRRGESFMTIPLRDSGSESDHVEKDLVFQNALQLVVAAKKKLEE